MERTTNFKLKKPSVDDFFDVDDLNENFDAIDKTLHESRERIGDVKITIREITDPSWLLCNNTVIQEEDYPELYAHLGAQYDIFKNTWKEQSMSNGGTSPIYAADGYIYFIPNTGKTAYRCKPDFSEYETYTLKVTCPYVIYYNELWFTANASGLHYSTDGFKENITTNSTFSIPDADEYTFGYVSYGEGYWYVGRVEYTGFSTSCYRGQTFRADSLTGEFEPFYRRHIANAPQDKHMEYSPYNELHSVIYDTKGGVHLFVQYYIVPQTSSNYYKAVHYYSPEGMNGVFIRETDPSSYAFKVYKTNQRYSIVNETGHIMFLGKVYVEEKSYSFPAGYTASRNNTTYFKGSYYAVNSDGIISRFNAFDTSFSNIETTDYYQGLLTSIGIGASDTHLYALKDTETLLYIEDFEERVVPALEFPEPYKAYIKCK